MERLPPRPRSAAGHGAKVRSTSAPTGGLVARSSSSTPTPAGRCAASSPAATRPTSARSSRSSGRISTRASTLPGGPKTLAAYVATWLPALRQRVRPSTWRRTTPTSAAISSRRSATVPPAADADQGREDDRRHDPPRALSLTARGARTTLRMILRDAERDGLVARNVAALARPPRISRHELSILSADETRRLLDGTVDDEFGPIYVVAATTGMRQGEILGLRWQDVELAGPTPSLTVRRSLAKAEKATTSPRRRRPAAGGRWSSPRPRSPPCGARRSTRRRSGSAPATSGRTSTGSSSPTSSGGRSSGQHLARRSPPRSPGSGCRTSGSTTSGTASRSCCWRRACR